MSDNRRIRVGSCPVLECPANHGEEGCSCGFRMDNVPCYHPVYRRRWAELTYGESITYVVPRSLTARVDRVRRDGPGMTPQEARERARQLALDLEV